MARTALDNATEFGRHVRFGDWSLGLLVACSVEPATHGGDRRSTRTSSLKVNAEAFARTAHVDAATVRRYYDAWENAAAKRIVPKASTLVPDDVDDITLPEGYVWSDYYTALKRYPREAVTLIEQHGPSAVVEGMTSRQRREFIDALVDEEPQLAPRAIARTERMPSPSVDVDAAGRRAGSNMARALQLDLATDHLRAAARELASAEVARREFGIEHPEQEAEALERVDRYREVYGNGRARWSKDDRDWLDPMGVTL